MEVCPYVYNPVATAQEKQFPFVICFEEGQQRQEHLAGRVIAHLRTLDHEALKEQAIQFFKWTVLHRISSDNLKYAQRLLEFFHSKNLLQQKVQVNNPQKQQTQRYLVIFTMTSSEREHVFSKTYNSIRELKADTGKKPSQIICQPTSNLFCELLTN